MAGRRKCTPWEMRVQGLQIGIAPWEEAGTNQALETAKRAIASADREVGSVKSRRVGGEWARPLTQAVQTVRATRSQLLGSWKGPPAYAGGSDKSPP